MPKLPKFDGIAPCRWSSENSSHSRDHGDRRFGDEAAVECLLPEQATMCSKTGRQLGPAVVRALQDEKDRRAREAAEVERKRLERALREAAAEERGRLAKELP